MILKGKALTKTYREGRISTPVLKGVDFGLEAGEVVALEGPSGSGKTTLLQILGCILSPSEGHVEVMGRRISDQSSKAQAEVRRRHFGFVFQQFNLFPALTVRENIEYALNLKGIDGQEARHQAQALVESVGLAERASYLPRDLSGGQKQRVAIARALGGNPSVILADEPTANLDSEVGTQILGLFREIAKGSNRGLLVVTHDPKVRTIADRVVSIRDGLIHMG